MRMMMMMINNYYNDHVWWSWFVVVMMVLLVGRSANGDSDPLQDFCVAEPKGAVKVDGFPCKDPLGVTPEDFSFSGLGNAAAINNTLGFLVTAANVEKVGGMNTLGISMARIDYAPNGINPPHTHPRGSEVIFVLEGQLEVGFITTTGRLISKVINKGDIFIFPRAILHFQRNTQNTPASVIAAFNSQLPGLQSFASSIFGSNPPIPDDILARTFQLGVKKVQQMKITLAPKKK